MSVGERSAALQSFSTNADGWNARMQRPEAPQERVVSAALRQPILAGLASLLVVAAAFFGLLRLGPPTQWFS